MVNIINFFDINTLLSKYANWGFKTFVVSSKVLIITGMAVVTIIMLLIIPQFVEIIKNLIINMPTYLESLKDWAIDLTQRVPEINNFIQNIQIDTEALKNGLMNISKGVLDVTINQVSGLVSGIVNFFIAIVFAVVINWENPFTTLQLLFINLINDSLPAIALAFEVAEPNTMNIPPRDINEGILQGGTSSVILIRGIIISIVVIIAQYLGNKTSPILGAAMAFSTITLSRIFHTLPARSDNISVFNIGVAKNKYVLGAIGICLLLYLIVLLPGLRAIFSIPNYFGVKEFAICILLALISTVLMELVKIFKK